MADTSESEALFAARERNYAIERVNWLDPLSYVREMYRVPAIVGRSVTIWTGERGVIVGGDGQYIRVRVSDPLHDNPEVILHPTWRITYHEEVFDV